MNTTVTIASMAKPDTARLLRSAPAHRASQTSELVKADVQELPARYRASKVIGSGVINDGGKAIGTIDDLLVGSDGRDPYAVLSIGGHLGMGSHLVVVPYGSLKVVDNKVTFPGGTKARLKMLPEFKYATK
jgi:PRC-barrel domain